MESNVNNYLNSIFFLGIGIFIIAGSIFYGIVEEWDLNGFGGMTWVILSIGFFFLFIGFLAFFEARGKKWAKIIERIILIIIALFILALIIINFIAM